MSEIWSLLSISTLMHRDDPTWCAKCGRFTKQVRKCSNSACRKPMCGRHTDNRSRCPECHARAIDPRNRRPWLQRVACAYCGEMCSVVQLAGHQSFCEQRPRRCPFFADANHRIRCAFTGQNGNVEEAVSHLLEHGDEFLDAFYEFTNPRAPDAIYWARADDAVVIHAGEKLASFAGGSRMLQLAVAQRRAGDDQTFRVQLRGTSRNSSMRIGFVQLESATSPTSQLVLPQDLLCPARRELFTNGEHVPHNVTIRVRLVAAERQVFYSCEPFDKYPAGHLPGLPLPADADVKKLFLAAVLDFPTDAAYLLPPTEGGWPSMHMQQTTE